MDTNRSGWIDPAEYAERSFAGETVAVPAIVDPHAMNVWAAQVQERFSELINPGSDPICAATRIAHFEEGERRREVSEGMYRAYQRRVLNVRPSRVQRAARAVRRSARSMTVGATASGASPPSPEGSPSSTEGASSRRAPAGLIRVASGTWRWARIVVSLLFGVVR